MADNTTIRSFFSSLTAMQIVGIFIGVLAIGAIAGYILYLPTQPDSPNGNVLTSTGTARGLITFSVAIVTVAIALILVLYVVLGTAGEDFKDRFTFGKDILMVFVGILGTIMGFYYAENKISVGDISGLKTDAQAQASAAAEAERAAFAALLSKDLKASLTAFATASEKLPTRTDLAEISRLLKGKGSEFAAAGNDSAKTDAVWQSVFCEIQSKDRMSGMTAEMIAKVKANCPNPPPTNPTNANGNGNANQTPAR